MSCSATLEHRVLYDVVALADDGRWTVIAPHAFYARADWDDFGLAHITDMHVARRIDSFRVTLEALGRTDAAAGCSTGTTASGASCATPTSSTTRASST